MLGGNASSEIRMCPRGAKCRKPAEDAIYDRETGLISELEERQIYGTPTLVYSIWDATLYSMLRENENITLCLNPSCVDAEMDGEKIVSVTGWQGTTYTWVTVKAKLFADCSGDSVLAPLSGAHFMYGREAKSDFGETIPPDVSDKKTMGMSCLITACKTDEVIPFKAPSWAWKLKPEDLTEITERARASMLSDMSKNMIDSYAKDLKIEIDYKKAGFSE